MDNFFLRRETHLKNLWWVKTYHVMYVASYGLDMMPSPPIVVVALLCSGARNVGRNVERFNFRSEPGLRAGPPVRLCTQHAHSSAAHSGRSVKNSFLLDLFFCLHIMMIIYIHCQFSNSRPNQSWLPSLRSSSRLRTSHFFTYYPNLSNSPIFESFDFFEHFTEFNQIDKFL